MSSAEAAEFHARVASAIMFPAVGTDSGARQARGRLGVGENLDEASVV